MCVGVTYTTPAAKGAFSMPGLPSTQRPPHYLSIDEFSRVRFSDEQWEELQRQLDVRRAASAPQLSTEEYNAMRKDEKRSKRNERVVLVLASILLGWLGLGVLLAVGVEVSGDESLYALLSNPIFLLAASLIAASQLH